MMSRKSTWSDDCSVSQKSKYGGSWVSGGRALCHCHKLGGGRACRFRGIMMLFNSVLAANLAFVQEKPVHLVHILADDLGHDDVSWQNPTIKMPTLGAMQAGGVHLSHFHTWKACAPSRGATMSGRYPFHFGFYKNQVRHHSKHERARIFSHQQRSCHKTRASHSSSPGRQRVWPAHELQHAADAPS